MIEKPSKKISLLFNILLIIFFSTLFMLLIFLALLL